jgi:pimeloyl-ACP methyl ester carboxylesterase
MSSMLRTHQLDLEDIVLHYGEAGPADGMPVLLLHGWPDLWFTWEAQMKVLAEHGYRAIAPDQRGYGRSSKPRHVRDYHITLLANDAARFLEGLKLSQPVHVVGHDWGAAVAWQLAHGRRELVRSLTIVNTPHPATFSTLLRRPGQLVRFAYMLPFQVPGLMETLFSMNDSALLVAVLRGSGIRDEKQLARYRREWRNPGATRMPLYWYRALFRYFLRERHRLAARTEQPTLLLWGRNDPVFPPEVAELSLEHCQNGSVHYFEAGHWPFHEQREEFNRELLAFLAKQAGASPALRGAVTP